MAKKSNKSSARKSKARPARRTNAAKAQSASRNQKAAAPGGGSVPALDSAEFKRTKAAIEKQFATKSKAALERAKELHKQYDAPETETLLRDAYLARCQDLLKKGMEVEAQTVIDLLRRRFPGSEEHIRRLLLECGVPSGLLDEFVQPLADPDIPAEQRKAIEDCIRTHLKNPEALATCKSLPETHPLRQQAIEVVKAFERVTSGPVDADGVALDNVPRRSPLAPWKMLIRAIAAFYRRDDETCRQCLAAIGPETPPARLVEPLQTMLEDQIPAGKDAVQHLAVAIGGQSSAFHKALEALDRELGDGTDQAAANATRKVLELCRQHCPDFYETLKHHIFVRGFLRQVDPDKLEPALGGPCLHDAHFWLLMARGEEDDRDSTAPFVAAVWEQFRRHAIHEGWFAEDSQEAGLLYRHMAEYLAGIPEDLLEEYQDDEDLIQDNYILIRAMYHRQPPEIMELAPPVEKGLPYYMDPHVLFQKSVELYPCSETYKAWLDWLAKMGSKKLWGTVAEQWHKAFPNATKPVLHLAEAAEERGAFQKALKYLEKAEAADGLNPEVRRSRFRLYHRAMIRHFKQGKPHLVEKDINAMAALPRMESDEGRALIEAFRWCCEQLRGEKGNPGAHEKALKVQFRDEALVQGLLWGAANSCFLPDHMHVYPRKVPKGQCVELVLRMAAIGDEFGVFLPIPESWMDAIEKELPKAAPQLDENQLLLLGNTAIAHHMYELAYVISGHGLKRRGQQLARFLLLRTRSLSRQLVVRENECLKVTAELARRARQLDVLDEVVDLWRSRGGGGFFSFFSAPMDTSLEAQHVEQVLQLEERYKKGSLREIGSKYEFELVEKCSCENCKVASGRSPGKRGAVPWSSPFDPVPDDDFDDEDDFDDDFDDDDEMDPPSLNIEDILDLLFPNKKKKKGGAKSGSGNAQSKQNKGRKKNDPNAPVQEELFPEW